MVVTFLRHQRTPLFGCYMPRALIETREINCWISNLRTFTPDFTFCDPIGFTVLQGILQGEGRYASHRPRLLSHPLSVSVYYALCFHPKSGALWIFDSAQSHYPQKRQTARMDLMRWSRLKHLAANIGGAAPPAQQENAASNNQRRHA
jgi:hypothetical protein